MFWFSATKMSVARELVELVCVDPDRIHVSTETLDRSDGAPQFESRVRRSTNRDTAATAANAANTVAAMSHGGVMVVLATKKSTAIVLRKAGAPQVDLASSDGGAFSGTRREAPASSSE